MQHRSDLTVFALSSPDVSPFCLQSRPAEGLQSGDHQDRVSSPTQFDFSPSNLEQLQEEDQETFRCLFNTDSQQEMLLL